MCSELLRIIEIISSGKTAPVEIKIGYVTESGICKHNGIVIKHCNGQTLDRIMEEVKRVNGNDLKLLATIDMKNSGLLISDIRG